MNGDNVYLFHIRDVLIHEYMGVDLNAIWELTQQNLPELKTVIEVMLVDS